MTVEIERRDYGFIGLDTKLAEAKGLATPEWYCALISNARLKRR